MDSESNVELRKCPFCGGKAEHGDHIDVIPIYDSGAYIDADTYYREWTGCKNCQIWFYNGEDEEEGITVERWNNRADFKRDDEKEKLNMIMEE
mgnify:CR=1 FL=1